MSPYYFHGIWRFDVGFGNPNKTAALVAMLILSVWGIAIWRRAGFWIALALSEILGIVLLNTFSRGGIVAVALGFLPIIFCAQRPWPLRKCIFIGVSMAILVVVARHLQVDDRVVQGAIGDDKSISNRILIWKAAPKMMWDAPMGWGFGNAGKAYMDWYQPLDSTEQYRTLVNSHLTWLVEGGWLFRAFYVAAWSFVMVLCWPSRNSRILPIALGVWICFAVAAFFSSVAESIWLWMIPSAWALVAVYFRWKEGNLWRIRLVTFPLAITSLVLVAIVSLGYSRTFVHPISNGVVFGVRRPELWIVADQTVLGDNVGHALRQYLLSSKPQDLSVGIVNSMKSLPPGQKERIVIAGSPSGIAACKNDLANADGIFLLNPTFAPQDIPVTPKEAMNFKVVFGEFSHSPAVFAWQGYGRSGTENGAGDYISKWPSLVFGRF
jgi:hypothetical protein